MGTCDTTLSPHPLSVIAREMTRTAVILRAAGCRIIRYDIIDYLVFLHSACESRANSWCHGVGRTEMIRANVKAPAVVLFGQTILG